MTSTRRSPCPRRTARRPVRRRGRTALAALALAACALSPSADALCRGTAPRALPALDAAQRHLVAPPERVTVFAPGVARLVEAIDEDRWLADVVTLAGWNRYTRGLEILEARDWLVQELGALPGLAVRSESFAVGPDVGWNVLAELPGALRPEIWHLVGAHYDSTSEIPATAAPGAEDNASGCAGVLELARAFSAERPAETIFFICYSGEEQGLYGSRDHASRLVASGDDARISSVLVMDMIGYTGDADLDVLLESDAANLGLMGLYADAAAAYTRLRVVTSTFPFGSDHVPYLDRGMPALLVIENDWASYPDYHRSTDLPDRLSLDMGGEILRMNAAALAHLAGAPAAQPLFASGFETGDLAEWSATCNDCDK